MSKRASVAYEPGEGVVYVRCGYPGHRQPAPAAVFAYIADDQSKHLRLTCPRHLTSAILQGQDNGTGGVIRYSPRGLWKIEA